MIIIIIELCVRFYLFLKEKCAKFEKKVLKIRACESGTPCIYIYVSSLTSYVHIISQKLKTPFRPIMIMMKLSTL